MPFYDRMCPTCGWVKADCFEAVSPGPILCPNGHESTRVWIQTRSATVIGDEFPGGKTFENLADRPITVYSRSELKREMDARGLQPFVRHVPTPGSDRSPNTTRWDAVSQHTLDEAKKLLERVG